MSVKELVSRSENVLGGTPVFAGTRVPVQTLIDYLETGQRLDDFLGDLPSVSREQAVAFLDQAAQALLEKPTDIDSGRAIRPWSM